MALNATLTNHRSMGYSADSMESPTGVANESSPPHLPSNGERGTLDNDSIRAFLSDLGVVNLDDIPPNHALGSALGLPTNVAKVRSAIARELIARGLLSPKLPDGHSISRSGGSRYVNEDVVGGEIARENVAQWVRAEQNDGRLTNLDDIPQIGALGSALGLIGSSTLKQSAIAKELLAHNLLSPELPNGHPISKAGRLSRYVDKDVVGDEIVRENIVRWIRAEQKEGRFENLDEIPRHFGLIAALGLDSSKTQTQTNIAKELVARGILSSVLPEGHSILGSGSSSRYVNEEVVGKETAQENIFRWIRAGQKEGRITNLDDIPQLQALGQALGLQTGNVKNISLIAKELLARKILLAGLPDGHSIARPGRMSRYVDKDVVGQEIARENIVRWIRAEQKEGRFTNLDNIPMHFGLSTALGIGSSKTQNQTALAKELVARGILSPLIPDGHLISRRGASSRYLDKDVVGQLNANENIKTFIQGNFSHIGEIHNNSKSINAICVALNIPRSNVRLLRDMILRNDWLPSRADSGYDATPELFVNSDRKTSRPFPSKKQPSPISESLERDRSREITFVKGEAFEQLVGVFLAYVKPDARLDSQYCLDVDPDNQYFGCRVDWKIGNELVEVKFGRAEQNILETHKKHTTRLAGCTDLDYRTITLIPCTLPGVKAQTFGEMLHQAGDTDISEGIKIIAKLIQSQEKKDDAATLRTLQLVRDSLYGVTTALTNTLGEERKAKIREVLELIATCPEQELTQTLADKKPRAFNGMAATYEFQGKICRDQISLPAYSIENGNRDRFKVLYHFGDVRFRDVEDRDMAVLLECHTNKRIERLVEEPERIQDKPVFKIGKGTEISRHAQDGVELITDDDQLAQRLSIDPNLVGWVKEYVAEHGWRA